jgi:hypothetical protein
MPSNRLYLFFTPPMATKTYTGNSSDISMIVCTRKKKRDPDSSLHTKIKTGDKKELQKKKNSIQMSLLNRFYFSVPKTSPQSFA